ncbi:MAG TPA: hypothetical protein PLG90_11220 [Ignavibacteria bacterium]|nr:hypothetical protein [Ignavibacteria bacterium]
MQTIGDLKIKLIFDISNAVAGADKLRNSLIGLNFQSAKTNGNYIKVVV